MSNSRDNALFQLGTATLGVAALYYCVTCFISGINELKKTIPAEEKKGVLNELVQPLVKDFERNFLKDSSRETTLRSRVRAAAFLAGSGLFFFGSYKAFRALEAGESLGVIPAAIGLAAAGAGVHSLVNKKN